MATVIVRRLPVAEGVSLHALVWEGDGPESPFLLVHGLSSNCRTWEGVAAHLHERGHRVAAVDLRGHGQSDKPDRGYDFATLTADLVVAMSALGFENPIVVGQSTGGNLAIELAHRSSALIAGAVGIDGGALDLQDRWPSWDDCLAALTPPPFSGTSVDAFEAMLRRHYPDWSDIGIAGTMANCEVLADGTVRPWLSLDHHLQILRGLWEQRPLALLAEIDLPVQFILADSGDGWSASKRATAEGAVAARPGVRVDWLAGDHDLHVQQPAVVAELLLDAHG